MPVPVPLQVRLQLHGSGGTGVFVVVVVVVHLGACADSEKQSKMFLREKFLASNVCPSAFKERGGLKFRCW